MTNTKNKKNIKNKKKTKNIKKNKVKARQTKKYRKYNKNMIGGNNLNIDDLSKKESASFITPGTCTTLPEIIDLRKDLIESKETEDDLDFDEAINEYQQFSFPINGFLRKDVVNYYSDLSISSILTKCGESMEDIDYNNIENIINECINQNKDETFKVIDTLDFIFINPLCPKLKNKTILFRGSDRPYEKYEMTKLGLNEIRNKAYISTSKTIDALFVMQTKGDKMISETNNCCINVLIIDEGIPYLDLEIPGNKWSYQQEVLLPRGLDIILLGDDNYLYNDINYNVYLYRVKLHDTTYQLYFDFDYELIEPDKMIELLTIDKQNIYDLNNLVKSNEEFSTKLENLTSILDYYFTTGILYFCEKSRYFDICKTVLDELKDINSFVITNNLQLDGYEQKYNNIVNDIVQKSNLHV